MVGVGVVPFSILKLGGVGQTVKDLEGKSG